MAHNFESSNCNIDLDKREKITFIGDIPVRPNATVLAKTKGYKTFKLSVEIFWAPVYPSSRIILSSLSNQIEIFTTFFIYSVNMVDKKCDFSASTNIQITLTCIFPIVLREDILRVGT